MKSRTHLLGFIYAFLFVQISVHAQLPSAQNPPTGPFYQLVFERQAYFDSIHVLTPDSVFYHEGGEYAEFQKFVHIWGPRLTPHGDFDVYDELMRNYYDVHSRGGSNNRFANDDPWLEIGPKRRTNAMIGIGPIHQIAINRSNPDHMLCSSNGGGMFYTTDGADNWNNAKTDVGWQHSGCKGAAYYPGTTDHWYGISTIALKHGNRLSFVGGIFRTNNSGDLWDKIGDEADFTGTNTEAQKLLFDEKLIGNDHRLFFATKQGLYLTDNPAAADPTDVEWTPVVITPLPPSITALTSATVDAVVQCYDIEYLPTQGPTSTLCASMCFKVTHQVGTNSVTSLIWRFMRSLDNGDTWTEIIGQPAIDETIQFATVETSPAAPNSFYCLAINGTSWVRVYDALASTWTPQPIAANFTAANNYGAGNGFGVDPNNANSVFVSKSLGLSWYNNGTESNVPNGHADVEDVVGTPTQPNVMWVANHGGVSKITLNGITSSYEDKSDGLGIAEVTAMSTSETNPEYIVTGLFHDRTTLTRTPYGPNWDPDWDGFDWNGDGTRCFISRQDPNTIYSSVQTGSWRRSDMAETSNSTIGIPVSSQWWSEGAIDRLDHDRIYLVSNKINSTYTLYTTDVNGNQVPHAITNTEIEIKRSEDRGVTKTIISDFGNTPEICEQAFVSNNTLYSYDNEKIWWVRNTPANPDHLYVSLENFDWQQRLFRNTRITHSNVEVVKASWEEVPHPRRSPLGTQDEFRQPVVSSIAFDPRNENILYIAYNGSLPFAPGNFEDGLADRMVYRMDITDLTYPLTSDFTCGVQYQCEDITMNLPNTFVDQDGLVYEQGSDGGLYIATLAGVYFTNNKRIGAYDPTEPENADDPENTSGWVLLGAALPHVASRGLEINYIINRLRVGTYGRGVWEHHLHCPTTPNYAETGTYANDEYREALNEITSEAIVPAVRVVNYRAGSQVRLTPGFHASTGTQFHAFIHPCDVPGNSFRPKSLGGPEAENEEESLTSFGGLLIFPNPASEFFTINADFVQEHGSGTMRLYGATGELIMTSTLNGPFYQVDASNLRGLFLVVVESSGRQETCKIILQ